jgi:hypothetical protein
MLINLVSFSNSKFDSYESQFAFDEIKLKKKKKKKKK